MVLCMTYRPEIDGLRAVAVVPVILFHAGIPFFQGGFAGVDVFFVLSGYLITGIIIRELAQGEFSIVQFYERRARRILPALFTVLICCVPFAWMWMLPFQFKDFSQSIVATVFFASNVLFSLEDGYFDGASELKPLLHTWSLAVEEQFYLLFPILLVYVWKFGKRAVLTLIIFIAAVSFFAAEIMRQFELASSLAIFYLSPLRAWELLAGAICAFRESRVQKRHHDLRGLIGLIMVIAAMVLFDRTTPSPTIYTVVPVLGTCLIVLYGGEATITGRILSMPALVGIGLISYSAYLWHQPIFAFARVRSIYEPPPSVMACLAALSLLLAWFTWKYVETPFRRHPNPFLARNTLFATSATAAILFVGIGFYGHVENGRNRNWAYYIADYDDGHPCSFDGLGTDEDRRTCIQSIGNRKRIVLIGDSHALAFTKALRAQLAANDVALISLTQRACFPVPQTIRQGQLPTSPCSQFKSKVYETALALRPRAIVVITRWTLNIDGTRYTNSYGYAEDGSNIQTRLIGDNSDWPRAREHLVRHTETFFRKLGEKIPVVLISQVPEAAWPVPEVALYGEASMLAYDYRSYLVRNDSTNDFLLEIDKSKHVDVLDASQVFCPPSKPRRCVQEIGGKLLYNDDDHMSLTGAELLAKALYPKLARVLK